MDSFGLEKAWKRINKSAETWSACSATGMGPAWAGRAEDS